MSYRTVGGAKCCASNYVPHPPGRTNMAGDAFPQVVTRSTRPSGGEARRWIGRGAREWQGRVCLGAEPIRAWKRLRMGGTTRSGQTTRAQR
jgi:hypothetical protein